MRPLIFPGVAVTGKGSSDAYVARRLSRRGSTECPAGEARCSHRIKGFPLSRRMASGRSAFAGDTFDIEASRLSERNASASLTSWRFPSEVHFGSLGAGGIRIVLGEGKLKDDASLRVRNSHKFRSISVKSDRSEQFYIEISSLCVSLRTLPHVRPFLAVLIHQTIMFS